MANVKNLVIGLGVTASIIGAIAYVAVPKKETITVKTFTWRREVDIEVWKEVEESGWEVPEGATITHVSTRSRMETDISNDEVTNNVHYRPYYTYKIMRWVVEKTIVSDSSMNEVPFFNDKGDMAEGRRYGERRETYNIIDENGNVWSLDYAKWTILKSGDKIKIKHYRNNNTINKMEKIAK